MSRPTTAPRVAARMPIEQAAASVQAMLDGVETDPLFGARLLQPGGKLKDLGYDAQGRGYVTLQFRVGPEQSNALGTLHGAAYAGLVEGLSVFPLLLHTTGQPGAPWSVMGVNISLGCSYLASVPIGSWVEADAALETIGGTLASCRVSMYILPAGPDGKRGKQFCAGTATRMDNAAHFKHPPGFKGVVPVVPLSGVKSKL